MQHLGVAEEAAAEGPRHDDLLQLRPEAEPLRRLQLCREMQMARLPKDTWSAASTIVTGMPRWDSTMATAIPTGPPPTTTTGNGSASGAIEVTADGGYFLGM